MSDLQFEDQQYNYNKTTQPAVPKGIAGFIVKIGLAKNASQANLVMIGLIVILMIISWFSLSSLGNDSAVIDNTVDPLLEEGI